MGTRADFFVGRGEQAEWLGSIAWDGYPDGNPEPLADAKSEEHWRELVAEIVGAERGGGTTPAEGWPWPWADSRTTDYAYAWDGEPLACCFGHGWRPMALAVARGNSDKFWDEEKTAVFPRMDTSRFAHPGERRSGLMLAEMSKGGDK